MPIKIETQGEYRNGYWIITSVDANDDHDQRIQITLDTDGTYCIESKLLGDEKLQFSGGLSFDDCWLGLATHFGLRIESAQE